jgi:hypothetical protein
MKTLLLGLLIGFAGGVYVGTTVLKDDSLIRNPFAEKSIKEKVLDAGDELIEKGKDVLK